MYVEQNNRDSVLKLFEETLTENAWLLFRALRAVTLNGDRRLQGVLKWYNQFMSVVLDDCVEVRSDGENLNIGWCFIRNSIILRIEIISLTSA